MTVLAQLMGKWITKGDGLLVIRPVDNSHSQGLKLVDETQHQNDRIIKYYIKQQKDLLHKVCSQIAVSG